jgi:hypothetical protein
MPFSGFRRLLQSSPTDFDKDDTKYSLTKKRQASLKLDSLNNSVETDLLIDTNEAKENAQPMTTEITNEPANSSEEVQNTSLIETVTAEITAEIVSEGLHSPPSSPQLKEEKDVKPR